MNSTVSMYYPEDTFFKNWLRCSEDWEGGEGGRVWGPGGGRTGGGAGGWDEAASPEPGAQFLLRPASPRQTQTSLAGE